MKYLKNALGSVSRKMSDSANFVGRKMSNSVSFRSWEGKTGSFVWGILLCNAVLCSIIIFRLPSDHTNYFARFAFMFLLSFLLAEPFFKAHFEKRRIKRDQDFHKKNYQDFKNRQLAKAFRESMGLVKPLGLCEEDEDYIARHLQANLQGGDTLTDQELLWMHQLNQKAKKIKKQKAPSDE